MWTLPWATGGSSTSSWSIRAIMARPWSVSAATKVILPLVLMPEALIMAWALAREVELQAIGPLPNTLGLIGPDRSWIPPPISETLITPAEATEAAEITAAPAR